MADETGNVRWERVQRLLKELEYEIVRGMIEGDLDEDLGLRFYVPISKKIPDGVVFCEFKTRPIPRHMMGATDITPRLKIVGNP